MNLDEKLEFIYKDHASEAKKELEQVVNEFKEKEFPKNAPLSEKTAYLITYGDAIFTDGEAPLKTLKRALDGVVGDVITDVHLLPMFPYTSDDGFSVTDYYAINPEFGDWEDIYALSDSYRLMFDFVANHMSKSSEWFQTFLDGEAEFKKAFVEFDEDFDTSQVTRPRTSPLFHDYRNGKKVWTTFSEDQVDVNAKDPKMLAHLTHVLLTYALRGASSIRLDAIGFLWKESGTTCIHLPQTHEIIKIWRGLLDELNPNTQIITETNVPHQENMSYFGNHDEANQVYQFALPPLVLHTFTANDAAKLTAWAKGINKVGDEQTFFNFLASHDGIGMRPVEGILTEGEKQVLADKVIQNGGRANYKSNVDGSQSVYELNINYSEALRNPQESEEVAAQKMLAAHHIMFSLVGAVAIYYHSLFGSKNDYDGLEKSGINRRINREKLEINRLLKELEEDSYRKAIFNGMKEMLKIRRQHPAFSPYAEQKALDFGDKAFALERRSEGGEVVWAITNVSADRIELKGISGKNLFTGEEVNDMLALESYGFAWILK